MIGQVAVAQRRSRARLQSHLRSVMTREYTKIVVGQAIEENAPFLAETSLADGGAGGEVVETAVPVYAESVYADSVYLRPPPPGPGAPGVYGTYPSHHVVRPTLEPYGEGPGEDCAQIGCMFSWIPIVGCVTCFLHADAPPNSKREIWASRACVVSTIVTIALVVFFTSFYNTASGGGSSKRGH